MATRSAKGRVFVYNLYGEINTEMASDFFSHIGDASKADRLEMYINSGGGDLFSAWAIYNHARRAFGHKKVTTLAVGSCDSSAVLCFMLGDKRIVFPSSHFGFHSIQTEASCGPKGTKRLSDYLDKVQGDADREIANRAGLDIKTIARLTGFQDFCHKTAEEALKMGLATHLEF